MKMYAKISALIVATVLWFGVAMPGLISADDDILFGLGVLGLIVYPPIAWSFFKNEIKYLKEKL